VSRRAWPGEGRVVVVTGGGGGIGSAFARLVAERGARVVLVDLRAEAADAVAASLPGSGHSVVTGDLTSRADVERVLAEIEGDIAGVIVVAAADQGRCEIKRLWTVPHARGLGVARALVQAAVDVAARRGDITVRLTVWSWREAALRLYERSGFVAVASWDARPSLVCMERALRP